MSDAATTITPPAALPAAEDLAHLHVHSEYSLLDGAIPIADLVDRAKALGHKAVALTDHGVLFGAIELYLKAKDKGLKAILGCEIFHRGGDPTRALAGGPLEAIGYGGPPGGVLHLVLLAKSAAGYRSLIKAVSAGFLEGLGDVPVVPEVRLDELLPGELIALSGCLRGEFGHLVALLRQLQPTGVLDFQAAGSDPFSQVAAALRAHVNLMVRRFGTGGYYVELIDNNLPDQRRLLPDLAAAARHFGLPLVATADAHYLHDEEAEGHAVLLGIKHGLTMAKLRGRRKGTRFHLLDNDEMRRIYADYPEALTNIQGIVAACNIKFEFGKYYLPKFVTGDDESPEGAMSRLARTMLEERFTALAKVYGSRFDDAARQRYRERLEYEIQVITAMGFASYFLIVQDFINWAKRQGIPVGPGRGSGAGSLVAYALRITDLDPLPYNLLFERFLNPERVSMPDFDVDFCQDRRDEVIRYVVDAYGADQVAQITTFGRMNAKAVVRDVGRVLDLGFGRVDRIAKLIPEPPPAITLDEAIAKEPRIAEEAARDESVADLLRLARQLEGLARNLSVHAAGVVISDGPMTDYVPVYKVQGEAGIITQYEMKMAEKVGLVKFDFLGLKTLTVIQRAVDLVRASRSPDFDIALIPLEDKGVYHMVTAGHTVGIFQLESSGMRNLVVKLKPSCFEDIIALVALFRPGPLGSGMVDDFIECKHGRKPIVYPLPQLEPILKETYGVMLYQEQVMKVAGELASYSLGEADLLRRAMGKKIAAEMEKQKSRFLDGAARNAHDPGKAAEIFDLMAKFADYGFNKSHSAAYGLVSYQTAYLKHHYPAEFMAAIMTCDLDNQTKLARYIDDCRRLQLKILPPDINRSELTFTVPSAQTIDFGLSAIKGVGVQALEPLLSERQKGGSFATLTDLAHRVNLHRVGKKTLELLIQAGALDGFGFSRKALLERIGEVVKVSEAFHTAEGMGQRGLFDLGAEAAPAARNIETNWRLSPSDRRPGAPGPDWLRKEKALLGVFLTGHPLTYHQEDRRAFGRVTTADIAKVVGKKIAMVVVLAAANERITKSGKRMASLRLEDEVGAFEAVIFEEELKSIDLPPAGEVVVVVGDVSAGFGGGGPRLRLTKVDAVSDLRAEHVRRLVLRIKPVGGKDARPADYQDTLTALRAHLSRHPGDTPLRVQIHYGDTEVLIEPTDLSVEPTNELIHGLGLPAFEAWDVRYEMFGAAGNT